MNQKDLLANINKYLSRFEAQVRIANANNEYDINLHSENVLIPILNLIYNAKFVNTNYFHSRNNIAIDLIDESKKIMFQVTSTINGEKIKSTLKKVISSKYCDKVDALYIYMLQEKKEKYSQPSFDSIINGKFKFNYKNNVLDSGDIYRELNRINNLDLIIEVEKLLHKQFSDLILADNFTYNNLDDFKEDYKKSCLINFSRINFFGLSVTAINRPREIELYALFVKPRFALYNSSIEHYFSNIRGGNIFRNLYKSKIELPISDFDLLSKKDSDLNVKISALKSFDSYFLDLSASFIPATQFNNSDISLTSLFQIPNNLVVIGKPGAGKSSFIKYTICKILDKDSNVFPSDILSLIPFRIELHKFDKYRLKNTCTVIEYLSYLLKDEYHFDVKPETLNKIFLGFPSIIFFDGLDEVFDVQRRIEIRNIIQIFLKQYNIVKGVVTSRYESYDEVNFNSESFTPLEILDFNDVQVNEYVDKWYKIEEIDTTRRSSEVRNFLSLLNGVDAELKYNPLLLSLILLLYRSDLTIPTSKLDIYESCTNTIVETRDSREKKLDISITINNKPAVFSYLAYNQFVSEIESESPWTNDKVILFLKSYFLKKGELSDDNDAKKAAEEFLNFAKIRSIYFDNKFTHKTFLEYYVAYYLSSHYFSNHRVEFFKIVSQYIGLSSWSVVLELLICKIDSNQITFEIIDDIVDKFYAVNKIDSLLFFLSIIKYLTNISPRKVKFLIDSSIIYCSKSGEKTKESKVDYQEVLFLHLVNLYNIDRFQQVILDSYKTIVSNNLLDDYTLNAFAQEFKVVSGNSLLYEYFVSNGRVFNSEYSLLLELLIKIINGGNYFECLNQFRLNYPNSISKIYFSPFKQQIFFGSSKFNWCLSYFSTIDKKVSLYDSYLELIKNGLSVDEIVTSAKTKSSKLDFEWIVRSEIFTKRDKGFKKFLNVLKMTYSPQVSLISKNKQKLRYNANEKFYDKFFKVFSKNRLK